MGDRRAIGSLEVRLKFADDAEQVSIHEALVRRLGEAASLDQLLALLDSTGYRARCSVANVIGDLVDDSNRDTVIKHLEAALAKETTRAAQSSISKALQEIVA